MANNVQIKFDFNNKDVEIASNKVLTLTQQIRILKKELGKEGLSAEQFEILSKKLGEFEDTAARTSARSKDLVTSLQLIPGPIGQIASQVNGTISLLKTFSGFKFQDLKFQFKETLDDVKEIGQWIGKTTGLTKLWTVSTNAMAAAMRALGVAQQTAAVASKALAAAIAATGIGLLVVAIGTLIPKIIDWVSNTDKAKEAQDRLAGSIDRVSKSLEDQQGAIQDQAELDALRAKAAGKSEKEIQGIREKGLQDQIEADKKALSEKGEFQSQLLKIETDATLKDEQREELRKKITEERNKVGRRVYQNQVALEKLQLQNTIDNNAKTQAQGQKNLQDAQALAQKEIQFRQDILRQRKEALDVQIQNEIDAANTSETKLTELFKKRNQLELDELTRAENTAKAQLKSKKITSEEYNQIIAGIEAKRVKLASDTSKQIKDAIEGDKKVEDDRIKSAEDFNRKIRDIKTAAITDDVARSKQERQDKYNDDLAALEADKEFIKKSETEKAEIRKLLKTGLDNDLAKIDKDSKDKDIQRDMDAYQRKLRILELQGQGLLKGTQAYFANRTEVLKTTEAQELAQLKVDLDAKKLTQEEYQKAVTATENKYVQLRKNLKQEELQALGQTISASLDAFANLGNAIASSYDEEAKTSEAAFNKRKKLQIATAVMSAASGIVQILTQPSTLPSPFDWIVKGVNAAALGISTAVNISKIKKTQFQAPDSGGEAQQAKPYSVTANRASGGIVTGPGTSTSDSINARLSNGEYVVNARATSAFLPLLNAINDQGLRPRFANGGLFTGQNQGMMAAESITEALSSGLMDRPVKTYVVGTDMSSQQQLDRTIKSRSII